MLQRGVQSVGPFLLTIVPSCPRIQVDVRREMAATHGEPRDAHDAFLLDASNKNVSGSARLSEADINAHAKAIASRGYHVSYIR